MFIPVTPKNLSANLRRMKVKNNGREPRFGLLLLVALACLCASCSSGPTAGKSPAATTNTTSANAPAAPNVSPTEMVAQAEQHYAQRADLAQIREAIAKLKQARAVDYTHFDTVWRLSKCSYYLGDNTKDKAERDRAFEDGVEAGQAAIKLQPDKPEGHFWLAANLGGQAQASALSGLGSVDDIRTEMQTVIKLDEGFMSGSAYMALGQIELELPSMMGGDPKKAVEYLEKGLRFGETNALLRLRLAQAYQAVERKADARKQLDTLINMKPDPNYVPEHQKAVAEARKMLEKGL
jgi:tetratricopeptide (TPR) repeat protein